MARGDVDVSLSDGVLTFSGERNDKGYLIRERRRGSFQRSMSLSEGVDESRIKANFKDGVLEVKIADGTQAVEPQPRKIEIEGR